MEEGKRNRKQTYVILIAIVLVIFVLLRVF
jgi:hypothetical protein